MNGQGRKMVSCERWCDLLVKERGGALDSSLNTQIPQQPSYKKFGHLCTTTFHFPKSKLLRGETERERERNRPTFTHTIKLENRPEFK